MLSSYLIYSTPSVLFMQISNLYWRRLKSPILVIPANHPIHICEIVAPLPRGLLTTSQPHFMLQMPHLNLARSRGIIRIRKHEHRGLQTVPEHTQCFSMPPARDNVVF